MSKQVFLRESGFVRGKKKIGKRLEVRVFRTLNARLKRKCELHAIGKTIFVSLLQEKEVFKIGFQKNSPNGCI